MYYGAVNHFRAKKYPAEAASGRSFGRVALIKIKMYFSASAREIFSVYSPPSCGSSVSDFSEPSAPVSSTFDARVTARSCIIFSLVLP